jgi:hypothetical protein
MHPTEEQVNMDSGIFIQAALGAKKVFVIQNNMMVDPYCLLRVPKV